MKYNHISKLIIPCIIFLSFFSYLSKLSSQNKTMTFDNGPIEPGFSFSNWSGSGGELYANSLTVNDVDVISKDQGCFDAVSFQIKSYYSTPGGGQWRAFNDKGQEVLFFVNSNSYQTVTLNWTGIKWFKLQLHAIPVGSNPVNTFVFDNFVYAAPVYPAASTPSVTASPTAVCSGNGSTLNISGNLNNATQWVIYSGSCGGTLVGSTSGTTLTVYPTPNTTYYVRGEGGCAANGSCGSVDVSIKTVSTPLTSATADLSTFCSNQSVALSASGGIDGSVSLIKWYTGANGTGTFVGAGSNISVKPTVNTTYYARREDPCDIIYDKSVNVIIPVCNTCQSLTTPTISVHNRDAPDISPICVGTTVTFIYSLNGGGTNPSIKWYKNGTLIPGQTGLTYTDNTLKNGDQIQASVTANNTAMADKCIDTKEVFSGLFTVIIVTVPTPQFTIVQPTCTKGTGVITVISPSSGVTYSFDGGKTYGALNVSADLSPNTYAVYVKDNTSGCTASTVAILNLLNVSGPTFSVLPSPTTINCPATPNFITPTATDYYNVPLTPTYNDLKTNGFCTGSYIVMRTWSATDGCGKTATTSQIISVQDITAPVFFALPAPTTINYPAKPIFMQAVANDGCGSGVNLTSKDVTVSGKCSAYYTVIRTWTAVDGCGNTSTAIQTINVQNITPPTFSALPSPTTINCPNVPNFTTPTALDVDGFSLVPTFKDVTTTGKCAGIYSVTRIWTAIDVCGNSSVTSQTINVQSMTAPVFDALPKESTTECPNIPVFAQAVVHGACGTAKLSYVDVTTTGATANAYTVTRTWSGSDDCGNSSTVQQIIHVLDMPLPTITVVSGTWIASQGSAYQWYIGSTLIPGAVNQFYFPTSFGDYRVLVTNSLGCKRFSESVHSDADYNQTNCPQIHKNFGAACDDGNPNTTNDRVRSDCTCRGDYTSNAFTVNCPANITVVSTSAYGTVVTWDEADMFTSAFSTNCSSNINVVRTSGYYSGYPFDVDSKILEEYVATDACGNKSSCRFTVTTTPLAQSLTVLNSPKFNSGKNTGGVFALYQNTPNPVDNSTNIEFNLPNEESVNLKVFNISGQVLVSKNIEGKSGYNDVNITKSELNASGVLFYRLQSSDNTATKKMVVLE